MSKQMDKESVVPHYVRLEISSKYYFSYFRYFSLKNVKTCFCHQIKKNALETTELGPASNRYHQLTFFYP